MYIVRIGDPRHNRSWACRWVCATAHLGTLRWGEVNDRRLVDGIEALLIRLARGKEVRRRRRLELLRC